MMILLPFAALLATPADLHPTGPWEVAESDAARGCQVTRSFAGDANVQLGFETNLTGSRITMLLAAPKAMLPEKGPGEIRLGVSPGAPLDLHFGLFALTDPGFRLLKLFPDAAALDAIANAETLTVGAAQIRVPAAGLDKAIDAVRSCTEGLLTRWGVDPKLWRDGKLAGVGGQPQRWVTDDDADKILPNGVSGGSITALITTTTQGVPASCTAVYSTDPRLEAPFCALLMKRTRFRAPLGDDGKPIESYIVIPLRLGR
jgi:hypothetical protein